MSGAAPKWFFLSARFEATHNNAVGCFQPCRNPLGGISARRTEPLPCYLKLSYQLSSNMTCGQQMNVTVFCGGDGRGLTCGRLVPVGKYEERRLRILEGKSDANINFDELRHLLEWLGFKERTRGSHHIFRS